MLQRFAVADLTPMPWKNGGGTTREIVCQPSGTGMDDFDWRVSIATITKAGPFSAFPGVDRVIMLLQGDGVRLHTATGADPRIDHRLDTPLAPFAFSGDVALDCTMLGGTSTDFNVMTRRGKVQAEVRVLRAAADIAPAPHGLLLALGSPWQLRNDTASLHCADETGGWWHGRTQGWRAVPQGTDAALVAVRVIESGMNR
jgi:environmental stress-induced protein Ves